jgi:hypothetical protein
LRKVARVIDQRATREVQAMTVSLKIKTPAVRTWTADNFKEQLYLVVRSGNYAELTERVPVEWGQDRAMLPVIRMGHTITAAVFDRSLGGEVLIEVPISPPIRHSHPKDIIQLTNISWPGK